MFDRDQSAVVCVASLAVPTRAPVACPTLAQSTIHAAKMQSVRTTVRGPPVPVLLGMRVTPTSDVLEVLLTGQCLISRLVLKIDLVFVIDR